jgi:hypothetical protein
LNNAHLRIGTVEYQATTKSYSTRVQAFCDRFAMEGEQTHMLSIFGNDAEIAAISAAISSGAPLTAKLSDGTTKHLSLGDKVTNYRGHIQIPGRPRPVRHLLSFSETLMQNGKDSKVYLLYNDPDLIWATVISFLGLPATPAWAKAGVSMLTQTGKIEEMSGFNCSPLVVKVSREELLIWIGEQVGYGNLVFPEKAGPIKWPNYGLKDLIPDPESDLAVNNAEAA